MALACLLAAPSLVGPFFEREKIILAEQFGGKEAAEFYGGFGVPWHSMMNKESLGDIVSRSMPGRFHLAVLIASIFMASKLRHPLKRRIILLHVGFAFMALLLSERTFARFAVNLFPPLAFLQFPWRFLSLFNLFAAASLAGCFGGSSSLGRAPPSVAKPLMALAASILCALTYLPDIPAMREIYLPTRSRDAIRASLTTLDHENKYTPVGANVFDHPAPKALLEIPEGELYETQALPDDYTYRVNSLAFQKARFHQYWFEGWEAEIDGKAVSVRKDEEGLSWIEIPRGVHTVRFHFERTLPHRLALWGSWAGWLGLFLAEAVSLLKRFGGRRTRPIILDACAKEIPGLPVRRLDRPG